LKGTLSPGDGVIDIASGDKVGADFGT